MAGEVEMGGTSKVALGLSDPGSDVLFPLRSLAKAKEIIIAWNEGFKKPIEMTEYSFDKDINKEAVFLRLV